MPIRFNGPFLFLPRAQTTVSLPFSDEPLNYRVAIHMTGECTFLPLSATTESYSFLTLEKKAIIVLCYDKRCNSYVHLERAPSAWNKAQNAAFSRPLLGKFVFWSTEPHFQVNANSKAFKRKRGCPRGGEASRKRKRSHTQVQKCALFFAKIKCNWFLACSKVRSSILTAQYGRTAPWKAGESQSYENASSS